MSTNEFFIHPAHHVTEFWARSAWKSKHMQSHKYDLVHEPNSAEWMSAQAYEQGYLNELALSAMPFYLGKGVHGCDINSLQRNIEQWSRDQQRWGVSASEIASKKGRMDKVTKTWIRGTNLKTITDDLESKLDDDGKASLESLFLALGRGQREESLEAFKGLSKTHSKELIEGLLKPDLQTNSSEFFERYMTVTQDHDALITAAKNGYGFPNPFAALGSCDWRSTLDLDEKVVKLDTLNEGSMRRWLSNDKNESIEAEKKSLVMKHYTDWWLNQEKIGDDQTYPGEPSPLTLARAGRSNTDSSKKSSHKVWSALTSAFGKGDHDKIKEATRATKITYQSTQP